MQGYCVKCREKREMKDPQGVTFKNGRAATQGICAVCGTKISVIGGGKAAAEGTKDGDQKVAEGAKAAKK